jgi:hypothetical protein
MKLLDMVFLWMKLPLVYQWIAQSAEWEQQRIAWMPLAWRPGPDYLA